MYENRLIKNVHDKEIIKYYYLNLTIDELIEKLHSLKFNFISDKSFVPFNAQLKDYIGLVDNENNKWIAKQIDKNELFEHILFELAYYIDFMMQTLASPSILVTFNNQYFKISKIVLNGIQIGSYNYIENPFLKILANDLINRWLFFDEDRNPNNYMVIHNSKNEPLIITIDYNKVDLKSTEMKIKKDDKKFGWFRQEKTRFLTLLKPSNYENLTIDYFEYRLNLMMKMKREKLKKICIYLFKKYFKDYNKKAEIIVSNILKRREYINDYFRKWFKEFKEKDKNGNSKYNDLGKTFFKIYKNKT